MKVFLLVLFSSYFIVEFFGTLMSFAEAKTKKERYWRFVDTLFSAGMLFAFVKLAELLSEMG